MSQPDQQADRSTANRDPGPPREHAFYFEHRGRNLFGTLHEPAMAALRRGWVFCSPFGEERGFSQKMAVEWARVLCEAGYWVLRFDYRGYGDSEGLFHEFSADDHVEDILSAVMHLEDRIGIPCRGLWGMRLGASLAARAVEKGNLRVALALWDPIVSGEKYMDELLRATMAKEMANTHRAPRTRAELKQHMAEGGEVIVEGHPLTGPIHQSVAAIDLLAGDSSSLGPTLIVQLSSRPDQKVRRELESLRQRIAAAAPTDLKTVTIPPPWRQNEEYQVRPTHLFEPTVDWIRSLETSGTAGGDAEGVAPAESPAERAPLTRHEIAVADGTTERVVEFDCQGQTLRAVLHLPARVDASRPAVMMVTPGFNCRTARYRLYIRLARELAQRGWTCLRYDPRGIGDSDGWHDYPFVPDLYNAIEDGLFVPDVRAAAEYLEEQHGIHASVLIGLCGGSIASIRAAAVDERIVGVISSELPFRYTPKAGSTEAADDDNRPVPRAEADNFLRSYRGKLLDPVAWRRFFSLKSNYRQFWTSVKVAIARRLWAGHTTFDDGWFRERLGPRANLSLVRDFQSGLQRRVHLFCLFGSTYNSWYFSEIQAGLLAGTPAHSDHLDVRTIMDADPGFSLPEHTRQFLDTVTEWLESRRRPWGPIPPAQTPRG
ncbi:MAG: alpha/beta hydrolase [Polyangiaceae bacterium]|nr:alpha/beta hydrolase [Polyangiaceae bacterium]